MKAERRVRIGLLIPPGNVVMETEFNRWVPSWITIHSTRLYKSQERITVEQLQLMADKSVEGALLLAMAKVNLIVYGCTTGSMHLGAGWDQELAQRLEKATGIPTITTATAVVEALKAASISKAAVVTPYPDELNERVKAFLKDTGFQVASFESFRLEKSPQVPNISSEQLHSLALKANCPKADGIFISCTNLPTREVIDRLERDTGKPVVTSNQASLWFAFKKLGISEPVANAGHILWRS